MSYRIVQTALQSDAEAHGIATGMLCIAADADVSSWLSQLFTDEAMPAEHDQATLQQLFEQTRDLLSYHGAFSFDLLLPDDDDSALPERVEALCDWCRGFLFGVGYANSATADAHAWPGDCGEIMQDIVEFTKIDSRVAGEDDEIAYTEIREYLRAAVFTIKDQFLDHADAYPH